MSKTTKIVIEGVEYIPAPPERTGCRHVIVIDRGWIYAGDVVEEKYMLPAKPGVKDLLTALLWLQAPRRTVLERAVLVGRWSGGQWFTGMIANPKRDTTILPVPGGRVDLAPGTELYRVPVADDWGL